MLDLLVPFSRFANSSGGGMVQLNCVTLTIGDQSKKQEVWKTFGYSYFKQCALLF